MATPSGPQDNIKYTLTHPDGSVAVFNDPSDPNYVGFIRWAGLDGAEVREVADDIVEGDGGIHGDFWYGRRPVIGTCEFVPTSTVDRNTRITRLQQVVNLLREDGILSWTPDGGVPQFIRVRRNQRLQRADDPGWKVQYSIPLIAADPRIYSDTLHSVNVVASAAGVQGFVFPLTFNLNFGASPQLGDALCTNSGNGNAPAQVRIDGPINNFQVKNVTTNETIAFAYTLGVGEWFIIDTEARTVMLNGTTNRYSALDFVNTTGWWTLEPGLNDIRLSGFGFSAGVTAITVQYRDAWV